jgi:hypothetical protein
MSLGAVGFYFLLGCCEGRRSEGFFILGYCRGRPDLSLLISFSFPVQRSSLPVLCCDACRLIHFLLACLISTAGYRGFSDLSFPPTVVLVFESRWLPCLVIFFYAHSRLGRLLSDFLARVHIWVFPFGVRALIFGLHLSLCTES